MLPIDSAEVVLPGACPEPMVVLEASVPSMYSDRVVPSKVPTRSYHRPGATTVLAAMVA